MHPTDEYLAKVAAHDAAEERIERQAEREMDSLDRSLMNGSLTQAEYDAEVRALDKRIQAAYLALA